MEYWKIIAAVGTLVFLASGFLPLFGTYNGLVNEYQSLTSLDWASMFTNYPVVALGLLLLEILWPIALILCIVSIFRRKTALVAGIVGIVCWAGAVMVASGWPLGSLQYGAGVFAGFAGAIILIVAHYIKFTSGAPQYAPSQAAPPPPPPPSTTVQQLCPTCGRPLTFIQQYGRWYCYSCNKYP